ncbi:MAG: DJ-1/PfpI family protein [Gloeotrichia echinulata IR180]
MSYLPLHGKKIAILVESQYIPEEIRTYQKIFSSHGAEVYLMSRLWGQLRQTFVSEVEQAGTIPETLEVCHDFTTIKLNDFAAVIMAANYPSVRLRWLTDEDASGQPINGGSGRYAPAVKFIYQAMMNPRIIKGFPCHALWILSPIPEVLAGRKVTCNRVMLGDVTNAGGIYTSSTTGVVVDSDIVTSESAKQTEAFAQSIVEQIRAVDEGTLKPAINAATTPSSNISSKPTRVFYPKKRRILILLSEWGYWGEELIGPLEKFESVGYDVTFCTPTGKRPNAIAASMDPLYIDPPLGRSVTSYEMALKVKEIDDPNTKQGQRLNSPKSLASWFPERPYWSDPQFVRMMEIYNQHLKLAEQEVNAYDALLIVGGSGPIVDLANNQRVHDLILSFYQQDKPIAAECYGVACLAFARNIENRKSIIWGKRVTGHCLEYDYKDGTGFMESRGKTLDFNMGPPPYPLEYILRDATGPEGAFIGNFGHPTSVIVDYPFITGRSTPDSYLTGEKLIEVLDGEPLLRQWG